MAGAAETTGPERIRIHDVAVIGGGPGGSTVASLLARAGRDVVVFERARFPRFHIGESLLPHNIRIFDRLGVRHALQQRFLDKWGVEFLSSDGRFNRLFRFEEALDPQYSMCFQVARAEFDALLLETAAHSGAEVLQGAAVQSAIRESGAPWMLNVRTEQGESIERGARFLVDASGRDGFLARLMGLRVLDSGQRRAALFAHYLDVPRREGKDAGNIVIVIMNDGWFWLIPFRDGRTSVGVVADGARIREQALSPEAALDRAIERCPAMSRLMSRSQRVSPVYAASDWSYDSTRRIGENWILVGDAMTFIDPVFSTGVLLAMSSGELAADLLQQAIPADRLSRGQRRTYDSTVSRHIRPFRRMVSEFYGVSFSRLSFVQNARFGIPEAVLALLAGEMEPRFKVRWRLGIFHGLASLYRRFDLGPRIPLASVFEEATANDSHHAKGNPPDGPGSRFDTGGAFPS